MSTEGWQNAAQQPHLQTQPQQYGSRSYGNSNFRGGPRGGGGAGRSYNNFANGGNAAAAGGGGGWGVQQPRSYGGNGGGFGGPQAGGYGQRQSYGSRPPRSNYGQGGGAGFNGSNIEGSMESMEIDTNKVGMVIGRGGAKIREIQENFKVHVKIGRDPGENGFTPVTIRGENMAIDAAKNYIQQLVAVKY